MFSNVVVGIDESPHRAHALELARALAPDAALTLVNVYPYDARSDGLVAAEWRQALETEATSLCEEVRDRVAPGAHVRAIADGSAARGLHRVAAELGADLLVLGPARHRGADGLVLGSVARSALQGAPCPVAVARARRPVPPQTIAVAFDGSAEARSALDLAARLATERGATLRVATVVHPPKSTITPAYPNPARNDDLELRGEQDIQHAHALVARAVEGLPVAAEPEVLTGRPGRELEHLATFVDLMVVGSRSWGPVRQTLLGSVSGHLVERGACPVVVIPRGAATGTETPAADAVPAEA